MITFILSFGRGDAFEWIVGLFGSRRQGAVVIELYGKKVYQGQLQQDDHQRDIANRFLLGAFALSIRDARQKLDTEARALATRKDLKGEMALYRLFILKTYASDFSQRGQEEFDIKTFQLIFAHEPDLETQQLPNAALLLEALRKADRDAEARQVSELSTLRMNAFILARAQASKGTYFFGGLGTNEMLDRRVWLHQADKLGIDFTEEDVRREVNRLVPGADALTGKAAQDQDLLGRIFGPGRGQSVSPSELYKALTQELRASLARAVILGQRAGGFF